MNEDKQPLSKTVQIRTALLAAVIALLVKWPAYNDLPKEVHMLIGLAIGALYDALAFKIKTWLQKYGLNFSIVVLPVFVMLASIGSAQTKSVFWYDFQDRQVSPALAYEQKQLTNVFGIRDFTLTPALYAGTKADGTPRIGYGFTAPLRISNELWIKIGPVVQWDQSEKGRFGMTALFTWKF